MPWPKPINCLLDSHAYIENYFQDAAENWGYPAQASPGERFHRFVATMKLSPGPSMGRRTTHPLMAHCPCHFVLPTTIGTYKMRRTGIKRLRSLVTFLYYLLLVIWTISFPFQRPVLSQRKRLSLRKYPRWMPGLCEQRSVEVLELWRLERSGKWPQDQMPLWRSLVPRLCLITLGSTHKNSNFPLSIAIPSFYSNQSP